MRLLIAVTLLLGLLPGPVLSQSLSLSPSSSTPSQECFEVKLNLDPEGIGVQGLDVEIGFDPTIVALLEIAPGDWYLASGYPHYFHDYTTPGCASIRFSGALLGGASSAAETVAIIRFQALNPGYSALDYLLVDVRDGENLMLETTHSSGDRIIIEEEIPLEDCSLSQIKAIYR